MKIRILFYKAKIDGKFLDNAISFWSGLWNPIRKYSHAEVWWSNGDFETPLPISKAVGLNGKAFWGQCFTSTMRDKINGTVIRPAHEVLKHPERWDYCEIDVESGIFMRAWRKARAEAEGNEGYDVRCIFSFFFPVRFHNKKKNICSEITQKFLVWCGIFPQYKIWSPNRLACKLKKLGYEIKELK